jgi:hypothetical protein
MAVTAQAIVQNMAQLLGGFRAVAATSNGTTTTVVDTALSNESNDWYKGWWLRATSGSNDAEERRVRSFTQSTGKITVEVAFSSSTASGNTFELHKVLQPSRMLLSLQTARRRVFPNLSALIEDSSLVVNGQSDRYTVPSDIEGRPTAIFLETPAADGTQNNFLTNTNGASTDGLSGSQVTLTVFSRKDGYTDVPKYGDSAVKAVAAASQTGVVTETHTATNADLTGIALSYARWIYCRTASRLTIRLSDGTTNSDSATHGGTGWELMHVTLNVRSGATSIVPTIRNTSASPAFDYFISNGWLYMGIKSPLLFNQRLENWQYHDRGAREIEFSEKLPRGRQLFIQGQGLVTSPTAYATSIVITDQEAELFAIAGTIEALKRWRNELSGLSRDQVEALHQSFQGDFNDTYKTLGRRARNIRVVS